MLIFTIVLAYGVALYPYLDAQTRDLAAGCAEP